MLIEKEPVSDAQVFAVIVKTASVAKKLRIVRLALKMESACARLDTPEKHPALVQQKKKHLIVQGQLVAKFLALTSHIAHEP